MLSTPTLLLTLLLSGLVVFLPLKYFLVPYVIATCFLPADQRVIVFDLDFTCLRILIAAGVVRLLIRGETRVIRWNNLDRLVLIWALCGAFIYSIQWADLRAVIYKCGRLYDILGLYWLFRQRIQTWDDVIQILKVFAVCALIMSPFVLLEKLTGENPFSIFGRVGTAFREGKYRCQGAFPHSIIFGVFWAVLVPLFVAGWKYTGRRILYASAIAACLFMVWSSASSTPYGALLATVALLALYPVRHYGRYIVWSIAASLVALHLVMKAPVWHLLARIDLAGGSTGYHRFNLIDQTIRHFSEWALFGTRDTSHWGYHLFDVTNEYCFQAVEGGLITLAFFVVMICTAIASLARYSLLAVEKPKQWLSWGLCVSLLGHCVAFISVAYFGQIHMLLYLGLAISGMVYSELSQQPCLVAELATSRVLG